MLLHLFISDLSMASKEKEGVTEVTMQEGFAAIFTDPVITGYASTSETGGGPAAKKARLYAAREKHGKDSLEEMVESDDEDPDVTRFVGPEWKNSVC